MQSRATSCVPSASSPSHQHRGRTSPRDAANPPDHPKMCNSRANTDPADEAGDRDLRLPRPAIHKVNQGIARDVGNPGARHRCIAPFFPLLLFNCTRALCLLAVNALQFHARASSHFCMSFFSILLVFLSGRLHLHFEVEVASEETHHGKNNHTTRKSNLALANNTPHAIKNVSALWERARAVAGLPLSKARLHPPPPM